MVAPEVVIVERLEASPHRDHARTGGIERDGFDLLAVHARRAERLARGRHQRVHVVARARWVAWSGSSFLRISGYSAVAEPRRPWRLSKMETRTLSVPKSTPATMATVSSFLHDTRCASEGPVPRES